MWKCDQCGDIFERLEIAWGTWGGEIVDILDYWCPNCGNTEYKGEEFPLCFIGTN